MEEELYEKIDRYIAGELSGEEAASFEKELEKDGSLKERVELQRSVTSSLSSQFQLAEKEKDLRSTLQDMNKLLIKKKPIPFMWYAAAASVLMAGLLIYVLVSSRPQYADYAHYEPLALAERGEQDSLKHHTEEVFNAGNYQEAIVYLDALLIKDSINGELALYKGISLMELNRFTEANTLLDSIARSTSVYNGKALWFQALNALKQKDYARCQRLLERIEPSQEDYENAQALLKKL